MGISTFFSYTAEISILEYMSQMPKILFHERFSGENFQVKERMYF